MGEKKRFLLRLDPQVYQALQRWATDEWRSVNGQIEYLLREALRKAGRLPPPAAGQQGPARAPRPAGEDDGQTHRGGPAARRPDPRAGASDP